MPLVPTTVHGLIDALLGVSESIRSVAVYRGGDLTTRVRPGVPEPWSSTSDRYEEFLANPAILTLVAERGAIDRGGARYVLIRYDKFFRLLLPFDDGHISLSIEPGGQPVMLAGPILQVVDRWRLSGGREAPP